MIVSKIRQFGLKLQADETKIPFQHSANLQMQFIKDSRYTNYKVKGNYQAPGDPEPSLLKLDEDYIFNLGPQIFKKTGTLYISFTLYLENEEIQLETIEYEIRKSIGGGDVLPIDENTWMELVQKEVDDYIKKIDFITDTNVESITKEELDNLWNRNIK